MSGYVGTTGNPYGCNGLPAKVRARIVTLLNRGWSCLVIAHECKVSRGVVGKIRAEEGITERAKGVRKPNVSYVHKRQREIARQNALAPLVALGNALPTEAERRGYFLRLKQSLAQQSVSERQQRESA